jgi:hypothetical protein
MLFDALDQAGLPADAVDEGCFADPGVPDDGDQFPQVCFLLILIEMQASY